MLTNLNKKFKYHYHNGRKVYDEGPREAVYLVKHEFTVAIEHPTNYRIASKSLENGRRRTFTRWVEDKTRVVLKRQLNAVTPDVGEWVESMANDNEYEVMDDGNIKLRVRG